MKLTPDRARLKCGIAIMLLALVLLPLVDWAYLRGTLLSPLETRRNNPGYLDRKQKMGPFGAAVVMIIAGASLCFEFAGDPPLKKDPWEDEQSSDKPG